MTVRDGIKHIGLCRIRKEEEKGKGPAEVNFFATVSAASLG